MQTPPPPQKFEVVLPLYRAGVPSPECPWPILPHFPLYFSPEQLSSPPPPNMMLEIIHTFYISIVSPGGIQPTTNHTPHQPPQPPPPPPPIMFRLLEMNTQEHNLFLFFNVVSRFISSPPPKCPPSLDRIDCQHHLTSHLLDPPQFWSSQFLGTRLSKSLWPKQVDHAVGPPNYIPIPTPISLVTSSALQLTG